MLNTSKKVNKVCFVYLYVAVIRVKSSLLCSKKSNNLLIPQYYHFTFLLLNNCYSIAVL